jgi:hypothetical protein
MVTQVKLAQQSIEIAISRLDSAAASKLSIRLGRQKTGAACGSAQVWRKCSGGDEQLLLLPRWNRQDPLAR